MVADASDDSTGCARAPISGVAIRHLASQDSGTLAARPSEVRSRRAQIDRVLSVASADTSATILAPLLPKLLIVTFRSDAPQGPSRQPKRWLAGLSWPSCWIVRGVGSGICAWR